jgi:hypothetical protein
LNGRMTGLNFRHHKPPERTRRGVSACPLRIKSLAIHGGYLTTLRRRLSSELHKLVKKSTVRRPGIVRPCYTRVSFAATANGLRRLLVGDQHQRSRNAGCWWVCKSCGAHKARKNANLRHEVVTSSPAAQTARATQASCSLGRSAVADHVRRP